jgi:hypothetical protein
MKTKNQFRKQKCEEIERIWDLYPDLSASERLFMVLDDLVRKAIQTNDHTKLASYNELGRVFNGLFLNPKTGQPTLESINWVRRLTTLIKRDKSHPHIRPYTEAFIEILADGTEVVRYYLNLLRGSKAVTYVNNRLESQKQGLKENQAKNRDLVNVRKVMKEAERFRDELIIKQQDATRKKRKRGDK